MARSAINDRLLRCIIYSGRESAAGQSETPKHVSDDGSFCRKQPWLRPHQRSGSLRHT
jgi:hypothetical protein